MTTYRTEEFKPGPMLAIIWSLLSLFLLFISVSLFMGLAGIGSGVIEINATDLLSMVIGSILMLVAHEGLHGFAMARFGAQPVYGAIMIARVCPAFYCTADGFRFTRMRYLVITLAPVVVISVVGVIALQFTAWFPLILILALTVGGAVGDLWMAGMIVRTPVGTLFEDLKDGVRILQPAAESSAI